jgi:hypothetical protein
MDSPVQERAELPDGFKGHHAAGQGEGAARRVHAPGSSPGSPCHGCLPARPLPRSTSLHVRGSPSPAAVERGLEREVAEVGAHIDHEAPPIHAQRLALALQRPVQDLRDRPTCRAVRERWSSRRGSLSACAT